MTRFHQVTERMQTASEAANRSLTEVRLLAVSKKQPVEKIRELTEQGQDAFGENYVDEAIEKIEQLKKRSLEWHFIGPIQSNKTRAIAEHFDWVQSVDRLKVIRRLNDQRPSALPPLNVLIQVNIDGEGQKAGCSIDDLAALAEAVDQSAHLTLRGLMAIPAPREEPQAQAQVFSALHRLYQELAGQYASVDTLSAGMSADLEAAIACGSTMVRVGTDLFGPRPG